MISYPQFFALLHRQLEQPKQHVRLEAALVCLIQNNDVIASQRPVLHALAHKHAIGHVLDRGLVRARVVESDRVAHLREKYVRYCLILERGTHLSAQTTSTLLGNTSSDAYGGHSSGLCHGHSHDRLLRLKLGRICQELRQLRRLATARFAQHNHDLVLVHGTDQLRLVRRNRQVGRDRPSAAPVPIGGVVVVLGMARRRGVVVLVQWSFEHRHFKMGRTPLQYGGNETPSLAVRFISTDECIT